MKKLTLQSLAIIINNKEKINVLCLENKTEKFILYSEENIIENEIDYNLFTKMEYAKIIKYLWKHRAQIEFFEKNLLETFFFFFFIASNL